MARLDMTHEQRFSFLLAAFSFMGYISTAPRERGLSVEREYLETAALQGSRIHRNTLERRKNG